jgi:molybdenum cofactor cytidylyltransferase
MSKAPKIAALLLAAGRSTRMGGLNKLTADVGGRPLLLHAVSAVLASRARPVVAVVGHQAEAVREVVQGLEVAVVDNPHHAAGLSSSLKTGLRALPGTCEGVVILLGDMPHITADHIDRLIAAFAPGAIVVPTHRGRRGNPVLWPAALLGEMLQLEGDVGAKRLIGAHVDRVRDVDLDSDAIFTDVDTPEALRLLRR